MLTAGMSARVCGTFQIFIGYDNSEKCGLVMVVNELRAVAGGCLNRATK